MPRILDLVHSMPLACRHVIDLPWRLSALDLDADCDAAFWEDSTGKMVGFAACQYVWAVLDFFVLPVPEAPMVAADLFPWATARFQERRWPYPYYWVEFRDDDLQRQQLLKTHGAQNEEEPLQQEEDRYILFQHTLADLPLPPALPRGFQLRPLMGKQEAVAYSEVHRAAFESTAMTPEWRTRTLRMPSYRPELDLVISSPDGSLAGFCVGWLHPSHSIAQIEPLGVHPRFHLHGLGRILLLEILRRFKEHGATHAIVETYGDRTPARYAYEAVGFQPIHSIRSLKRWVNASL